MSGIYIDAFQYLHLFARGYGKYKFLLFFTLSSYSLHPHNQYENYLFYSQ